MASLSECPVNVCRGCAETDQQGFDRHRRVFGALERRFVQTVESTKLHGTLQGSPQHIETLARIASCQRAFTDTPFKEHHHGLESGHQHAPLFTGLVVCQCKTGIPEPAVKQQKLRGSSERQITIRRQDGDQAGECGGFDVCRTSRNRQILRHANQHTRLHGHEESVFVLEIPVQRADHTADVSRKSMHRQGMQAFTSRECQGAVDDDIDRGCSATSTQSTGAGRGRRRRWDGSGRWNARRHGVLVAVCAENGRNPYVTQAACVGKGCVEDGMATREWHHVDSQDVGPPLTREFSRAFPLRFLPTMPPSATVAAGNQAGGTMAVRKVARPRRRPMR